LVAALPRWVVRGKNYGPFFAVNTGVSPYAPSKPLSFLRPLRSLRLNSSYCSLRVAPSFILPRGVPGLYSTGEKIPFVTFVPFVVNFLFSSVSFLVAALPR
jgi:hypothetical protein